MDSNIEKAVLPFKLQQFVGLIMEKKKLSMKDALYYLYNSDLYEKLMDSSAKMWYLSSLTLYDMLEKEKAEEKKEIPKDSPVGLFQLFCLENYKEELQLSAEEVLALFTRYDVFGFLNVGYDVLHTQSRGYILDEIRTYIKNKKRVK